MRKFLQWLVFGKIEAAAAELKSFEGVVVNDVDELAQRIAAKVVASIKREIAKVQKPASKAKR